MIFAMFGTNPYQFTRLAEALEKLAVETGEEIVVQCGNTKYPFVRCKATPFYPHEEVLRLISKADCLIIQGGAGSISDGIRLRKPVVVVPRRPELGESPDKQEGLARKLEEMGCITAVFDVKDLKKKYHEALTKETRKPPTNNIPKIIGGYLSSLEGLNER